MAVFGYISHKEVGDDPCIQKNGCPICKAFTAEQVQQLAIPTYRSRKEKEQKKTVSASPVTSTPTLVDPIEVKRLGRVEGGRVTEENEGLMSPQSPARRNLEVNPHLKI